MTACSLWGLPHIAGQAHNLRAIPFKEDHPDVKVHDRTMGRCIPTTGPVTVPSQAEDMGGPKAAKSSGSMSFMTRPASIDTPNTMKLGEFQSDNGDIHGCTGTFVSSMALSLRKRPDR